MEKLILSLLCKYLCKYLLCILGLYTTTQAKYIFML